jgi:hypothetical protein
MQHATNIFYLKLYVVIRLLMLILMANRLYNILYLKRTYTVGLCTGRVPARYIHALIHQEATHQLLGNFRFWSHLCVLDGPDEDVVIRSIRLLSFLVRV